MSELDKLLRSYAPPPAPEGLARRSAEAALKHAQVRRHRAGWARSASRRGWRRPLLIGGASVSLAFTSALAATVASGGRIDIPLVSTVAAAVPIFNSPRPDPPAPPELPRPAASVAEAPAKAGPALASQAAGESPRRQQILERYRVAKQAVEQRRAAGQPTPRADRIEAAARRIAERRQSAGLETPPVEEIEAALAFRQLTRARQLERIDPGAITEAQIARFAQRLPPERRERFLALEPDAQRRLMVRALERLLARRAARRQGIGQDADSSEGISAAGR